MSAAGEIQKESLAKLEANLFKKMEKSIASRLKEALGNEAASLKAELDAETASVKTALTTELGATREGLATEVTTVKNVLSAEISAMREARAIDRAEIANLRQQIEHLLSPHVAAANALLSDGRDVAVPSSSPELPVVVEGKDSLTPPAVGAETSTAAPTGVGSVRSSGLSLFSGDEAGREPISRTRAAATVAYNNTIAEIAQTAVPDRGQPQFSNGQNNRKRTRMGRPTGGIQGQLPPSLPRPTVTPFLPPTWPRPNPNSNSSRAQAPPVPRRQVYPTAYQEPRQRSQQVGRRANAAAPRPRDWQTGAAARRQNWPTGNGQPATRRQPAWQNARRPPSAKLNTDSLGMLCMGLRALLHTLDSGQ
eukprot:GHVT01025011.1.p1 GENE.GHVT01025011.1~~GHVT01025011.1.p1  ORF type:complete len:365 (-),score=48.36 GHVT01025011.1:302-1396(-)